MGLHARKAVMLVTLMCVASVVVTAERFGEPRVNGHPLTWWLARPSEPGEAESMAARDAVRSIATRAVPVLLAKLQATNSPAAVVALEFHALIPCTVPCFPIRDASYDQGEAIRGFQWLGPLAKSAVPELGQRLYRADPEPAAIALAHIGDPAVPVLRAAMFGTNFPVRRAALVALIYSSNAIAAFLPELRAFYEDSSDDIAALAAARLMRAPDREERTAATEAALKDKRSLVREQALRQLEWSRGSEAKAHVPTLIGLLSHEDFLFRVRVTNALRRIDPDAAAAAGVFARKSRRHGSCIGP